MTTRITADFGEVTRRLGLLTEGALRGVALGIKGWLQETIQRAFETESTPEGVKWPPLSPKYAARKGGRRVMARRVGPGGKPGKPTSLNLKKILYLRGDLFRGFASMQSPGIVVDTSQPHVARVMAFSDLKYAAIHQYGGFAGRGLKAFIPQRSYLPTPEFAERGAARVVDDILQDAIRQAGL